jgi:predicted nucleic acid-binding Zn ribbon protein
MKDDPLKICPVCKGEIKRLIGAGAGPIFKGSGFYQTDYKNSTNSSDKKNADNSKSKTESSAQTVKTETKKQ